MSPKKDDCSDSGACPAVGNKHEPKLVKITDLPLTGNPYPPKDVIQDEACGSIEQAITSARMTVQPYLSPLYQAYSKASDIVSIGVAHSQSTFQSISENQNALSSGLIISGSTLFGLLLARRKGFFKKIFYMTTFFGVSSALCYQDGAKKNFDIAWVMAKNNLPNYASNQYRKLYSQLSSQSSSDQKENPKVDSKE